LPNSFGERLLEAFEAKGQLCVGIDPHASLLNAWDLTDSAHGLREFSLRVVDACAGQVSLIKPQVSFFERFGAAGYTVLEEVTQAAKAADLLVIADAKRGDIGTTMDAYLEAWFGNLSGLHADALTVSPYLGLGTISAGFARYAGEGKGVYSLVATSNPEGASVQLASSNGTTLAGDQWRQLAALNAGASALGNFGAVLGATLDLDAFAIDRNDLKTPILAPGFGAQGAKLSDAKAIYGNLSRQVAYSVSRSVLQAGARNLQSAISTSNEELFSGISQ
jgi:orotidine-5'-phosphate decarboxylase